MTDDDNTHQYYNPNHVVKTLSEVALRVDDLDGMVEFYRDVVGLDLWQRIEVGAFFRIGPDYGGHTQIMAMFDRSSQDGYEGISQRQTPMDHFAFTIDLADFESETERIKGLGLEVIVKQQIDFGWRSLFFKDPEGNRVEFVAYDPAVPDEMA